VIEVGLLLGSMCIRGNQFFQIQSQMTTSIQMRNTLLMTM